MPCLKWSSSSPAELLGLIGQAPVSSDTDFLRLPIRMLFMANSRVPDKPHNSYRLPLSCPSHEGISDNPAGALRNSQEKTIFTSPILPHPMPGFLKLDSLKFPSIPLEFHSFSTSTSRPFGQFNSSLVPVSKSGSWSSTELRCSTLTMDVIQPKEWVAFFLGFGFEVINPSVTGNRYSGLRDSYRESRSFLDFFASQIGISSVVGLCGMMAASFDEQFSGGCQRVACERETMVIAAMWPAGVVQAGSGVVSVVRYSGVEDARGDSTLLALRLIAPVPEWFIHGVDP
nr:hypothetical protein Iba_chr04eCG0180 [Ipomoea batatas]